MNGNGRNMYVFRDGRRFVPGPTLVEALAAGVRQISSIRNFSGTEQRNLLVDTLLRSGELECALSDAASPEAERLSQLTDALAALLVGSGCAPEACQLQPLLPRQVPAELQLSPPEGFAFYALHPLDFADLAAGTAVPGGHAGVIGIRSIGTTLSAIVVAALARRGVQAERITVRPNGHPYDRRTEFAPAQRRWIATRRSMEAEFFVVDEGPGMSGSSFLSVGEALLEAGAARSRMQFLCSRCPDVNALCARDAAVRWNGFRSRNAAPATHLPAEAKTYIGGGYWRHELMVHDPLVWPASWSQMERLKFLSPDRRLLFKFEGFGRFGGEVHARSKILGDAGYASAPLGVGDGFGLYPLVEGQILSRADLGHDLLLRMAEYCAFRAAEFASHERQETAQMESMVRFNVAEEFGVELNGDLGPLHSAAPVLVDGRMLPHEWLHARDGRLLKCDGDSHGDDHFFPGPATDICWDLAGAIVEWDMDSDARECFLQHYKSRSGDDPGRRLPAFLLAYTVFRMAYCKMAAAAMQASEEEHRLCAAYEFYRSRAEALLPQRSLLAAD